MTLIKLFAGTDHPVAHLYDINTFTCYLSANAQDSSSPINQVAFLFPSDSQALDCIVLFSSKVNFTPLAVLTDVAARYATLVLGACM